MVLAAKAAEQAALAVADRNLAPAEQEIRQQQLHHKAATVVMDRVRRIILAEAVAAQEQQAGAHRVLRRVMAVTVLPQQSAGLVSLMPVAAVAVDMLVLLLEPGARAAAAQVALRMLLQPQARLIQAVAVVVAVIRQRQLEQAQQAAPAS